MTDTLGLGYRELELDKIMARTYKMAIFYAINAQVLSNYEPAFGKSTQFDSKHNIAYYRKDA